MAYQPPYDPDDDSTKTPERGYGVPYGSTEWRGCFLVIGLQTRDADPDDGPPYQAEYLTLDIGEGELDEALDFLTDDFRYDIVEIVETHEYLTGVPEVEPTCDICGNHEWLGDWNPDTGNHRSCEAES